MGKQKSPPPAYNTAPWQQGQQQGGHDLFGRPTNGGNNSIDFYGAAGQQGADSQTAVGNQTEQNRPDQTNAFGVSSRWGVGPDGRPTQTSSFGGGLGDYMSSLQDALGSRGAFDPNAGNAARDQAIGGAYGQATSRLDPQWAQREQQQKSELAAQGLDPSSQAYQNDMGQFSRDRNDAYSSAMNGAIGQGTQAGSAIFNQNLAAYNNPMQQLQAMQGLTGQQGFQGAGLAQIAPWLQAALGMGNYGLGQVGQANAADASMWQGAGQAGSAIAGAALCDERAKTNVKRHGVVMMDGVPLATWEYRHEPGVRYAGVIAQDLQKVRPDLVTRRADGMLMVPGAYAPRRLP